MAVPTMTLNMSTRWWLKYVVLFYAAYCKLCRMTPSANAISAMAKHGTKIKGQKVKKWR